MVSCDILHQEDIRYVYNQCNVDSFACTGQTINNQNLHWWSWSWGSFFLRNTLECLTEIHKSSLFPYKQVSRRNCDHERLRMTNIFMLCDLLWKVQKNHAANREGSFKCYCWWFRFVVDQDKPALKGPSLEMEACLSFLHVPFLRMISLEHLCCE